MEGNYNSLRSNWLSQLAPKDYLKICDRIEKSPEIIRIEPSGSRLGSSDRNYKIFIADTYYGYGYEADFVELGELSVHQDNHTEEDLTELTKMLLTLIRMHIFAALAHPVWVDSPNYKRESHHVKWEMLKFYITHETVHCDLTLYDQRCVHI